MFTEILFALETCKDEVAESSFDDEIWILYFKNYVSRNPIYRKPLFSGIGFLTGINFMDISGFPDREVLELFPVWNCETISRIAHKLSLPTFLR